jgi:hypothetical protein
MNIIDQVDPTKLKAWCRSQTVTAKDEWNHKPIKQNRFAKWYGVGVHLGFNSKIYQAEAIDPAVYRRLSPFYPGFNSLLLLRYGVKANLDLHIDRDCFDPKVVLINSGFAIFRHGGKDYTLKNGYVYQFDSKIEHGIVAAEVDRFSLSLRIVR